MATATKTTVSVRSSGRINIIGEHTDYNDGFVLPASIDKHTRMDLKLNGSPSTVNVKALNLDQTFEFDLTNFAPLKRSGWENYIMGIVHQLQELGAEIRGFDASFEGNVPIGSGMSSSAALECSLAYALNELFELGFSKEQLIKAAQLAEHNYVGTKCGIMDQFASMMGEKDAVVMLDCRSLEYTYYPFELGDYEVLLLNTNVSHELASSEYNTRREECEEGVRLLQPVLPGITHLRDVNPEQLETHKALLPEVVYRRCRHVVTENQRVLDATKALKANDIPKLGAYLFASHDSLQHDYEVSCPELDFLVQQARKFDGVVGSRVMGGGFGGCTISIVHKDRVKDFIDIATLAYKQAFNIEPTPYSVAIEKGTSLIQAN